MALSVTPAFSSAYNSSNVSGQEARAETMQPGDGGDGDVLEVIPVITEELDGGWFGRVCLSAVLVLGTFGNLMTVTILRRLHRGGGGWSAMYVYLTGLAVSDTVMLLATAVPMWTRKVLGLDLHVKHVIACKGMIWMMNTSSASSAWLLVALTAQRAASVVWPHRVNVLCTRRKSVFISVVIAVTLAAFYSHVLYGYQIVQFGNGTSVRCSFGFQSYQQFWVDVWVRVDIFIYSLLPCLFLILSNAVLVWKLARSVKEATLTLSSAKEEQKKNRQKKASSTTVTIISVSTAFVLITLPLMIYNIFFYEYVSKDPHSKQFHYFLYDFFLVFCLVNFAWNFYLYCLTGTKFRREFLNIVIGCCRRNSPASGPSSEGTRASGVEAAQNSSKSVTTESNDDF
ncbi:uncharacterized protein LOC143289501 [Babylonia areolata]|uniref:uncharacterized protein LOC143289501 n=1 Tax=Babylonia areolata TaxID=304850 RepID=UPI003FD08597